MKYLCAAVPVLMLFACKTNNLSVNNDNGSDNEGGPTDASVAESSAVDTGARDSSASEADASDAGPADAAAPTFTTNPTTVRVVRGGSTPVQIDLTGAHPNDTFAVTFQPSASAVDAGVLGVTSTTASIGADASSVTLTVSATATGSTGVTTGNVVVNGAPELTVPLVVAGTSGSLDTSLNGGDTANAGGAVTLTPPGGNKTGVVTFVAAQSDGKIVLAGTLGASATWGLVRLNEDGSLDTSFESNIENDAGVGSLIPTSGSLAGLVVDPTSGVIFVGGTVGGAPAILALNGDGTPASAFGSGGLWSYDLGGQGEPFNGPTLAIAADGNRGVYVAWAPMGQSDSVVRHLDSTGTIVMADKVQVAGSIAALADDSVGNLYYAANQTVTLDAGPTGPHAAPAVLFGHMESTGTIDPSFPGPLPFPQLSAAATATDAILNNAGGLIATGFFSDEATTGNQVGFLGGVALDGGILFSGGANNAFLTQGTGYNTNGLFRAAAQGDGRVVFVGSGNSLASTPISYVGRMTTSGSFDPSFNAGLDGGGSTGLVTAQGVAPYTDVAIDVYGRIIVVGGGPNGWSVMRLWP